MAELSHGLEWCYPLLDDPGDLKTVPSGDAVVGLLGHGRLSYGPDALLGGFDTPMDYPMMAVDDSISPRISKVSIFFPQPTPGHCIDIYWIRLTPRIRFNPESPAPLGIWCPECPTSRYWRLKNRSRHEMQQGRNGFLASAYMSRDVNSLEGDTVLHQNHIFTESESSTSDTSENVKSKALMRIRHSDSHQHRIHRLRHRARIRARWHSFL